MRAQSARRRAEIDERKALRLEVIRRDRGCIFHVMAACAGALGRCSGHGIEVHEILPRGRGGSHLDPANCIALCATAHGWVTAHPAGAEAVGLVVPSWPTIPLEVKLTEAERVRFTRARVGRMNITVPSWRLDDAEWRSSADRDLLAAGWLL